MMCTRWSLPQKIFKVYFSIKLIVNISRCQQEKSKVNNNLVIFEFKTYLDAKKRRHWSWFDVNNFAKKLNSVVLLPIIHASKRIKTALAELNAIFKRCKTLFVTNHGIERIIWVGNSFWVITGASNIAQLWIGFDGGVACFSICYYYWCCWAC